MRTKTATWASVIVGVFGMATPAATAADAARINIEPPRHNEFVRDLAGMIAPADVLKIQKACGELMKARATPAIVVTIESMGRYGPAGLEIDAYAGRLFNQWGIGHKEVAGQPWNTGILLLVSREDRKARIELGAGWGDRKDALCREIMDQQIIPAFKRGEFSRGIVAGVDRLVQLGMSRPLPGAAPEAPGAWVSLKAGPRTLGEIAKALTDQAAPHGLSMDVSEPSGPPGKSGVVRAGGDDKAPPKFADRRVKLGFDRVRFWQAVATLAQECGAGIKMSRPGSDDYEAGLTLERRLLPGWWADGPWLVALVETTPRAAAKKDAISLQVFPEHRLASAAADPEVQLVEAGKTSGWLVPRGGVPRFGADWLFEYSLPAGWSKGPGRQVRFRFPANEIVGPPLPLEVPVAQGARAGGANGGPLLLVTSVTDAGEGRTRVEFVVSWDSGLRGEPARKYQAFLKTPAAMDREKALALLDEMTAAGLVSYRMVGRESLRAADGSDVEQATSGRSIFPDQISGSWSGSLGGKKALLKLTVARSRFVHVTGTLTPWPAPASRPAPAR